MATAAVQPAAAAGAAVVHALPHPEPLANLIDFGNLHKVLAYILDNLNSVGSRLTKIEGNVANLQETQNLHGDSIGALKSLLVNYRPGGSDEDMQSLRDKVAVMEGRLDSQTKEIVSLAHTAHEQSRTITGLESATASLQTIMPTKADLNDLALKASKSVVDRHEREIEDLTAVVKGDHEARLKILEAGFKRLSAAVDALTNDDFKAEAIRRITDLENQAKITVDSLNDHTRQIGDLSDLVATKAAQLYVDNELEGLLQRMKDLELALANSMKAELKRFERDVMIYVADQLTNASNLSNAQANANGGANGSGSGGHNHGQNTAAGKMHYRCLTCDQPRDNVPGPSTFRYGKAMGVANTSGSGAPASESRLLETQLGDQIYLHGTDGGIYKGRTEPHNQALLLAQQQQQQLLHGGSSGVPALPSSDLLRLQAGSGQVTQRSSSPDKYAASARKSRPQSADPSQSRTHAHRQQIDPASGRKSAFDLALPLSNLSGVGEEEGKMQQQQDSADASTARTLHFPSPNKAAAGAGGSKSGSTTSRASILPRSNSQTELMMANNAAMAAASASASASPTHPLSPLSTMRKARPSTASARPGGTVSDNPAGSSFTSGSSSGPPSGRLLTGHVAPESRVHAKSKNGVEMVRDYE